MRLYPLADATSHVTHGEATYKPAADGGFDFPPDLEAHLHAIAIDGRRQWETSIERQQREIAAELARRQSPEALYDAVSALVRAAETTGTTPAKTAPKATAKAGDGK